MAAVQIAKSMCFCIHGHSHAYLLMPLVPNCIALGCKVIATASTEEKRRICKEKGGADYTIDYTQSGWQVR